MKIEQMLAKVFGCLFLLWATFDVGAAQAEKVIVVTILPASDGEYPIAPST